MKKTVLIFMFALALILLTSCATIFSGSSDDVVILSEPAGADIYINGMRYGATPLTVSLEKGNTYQVELRKEGFESGYATITNKVGVGWVVLDVLGGLIPLVVDLATNAWSDLSPDVISIQL